ncbi:DMT family transporter [Sulfitobacter pseudonitzschiae]|uniref:DMT family transporter n=1 Tax=Pseudosulfitobacter pseudonitzschiae TaxID=1402135 RepID=A0A9Q2NTF3_9RHOB|nr:DMT family transporter [Pseudosulfitobacter pseudonitzschiae]MBM2294020.1 DMT family transporter [Pseudosulfitobacter pseudonitzschiae]MBM2298943.1 DMT family transporter [Pseudosulfitobacter pseudonitzschiae]MBM2303851.1 DMT family transporter [Pseudosulfitobacter pseudonitzschiae]MBM2313653.1 DMT family transporter [Pseudosulfitobacter pseudonitzschiae]MBM2318567.1 DMT family transporter [Pseudosulfitobacter pseudonitzschiae]
MSRNIQGILIALLGCLIYSAHDAIIKALGSSLPAVQIAFFAYLLGLPYVILLLIRDTTPGTLRPANPLWMAIRVVAVMVATLGAFYAFLVLPLAEAYTILFAAPLLVTLLAVPLLGEVLRWRRATAVLVGLAGVLVVLRPDTNTLNIGHAAALASAIGNAMVHISSRRIGGSERLPLMILYPMLGIIVLLGAVMPFTFEPVSGPAFGGLAIVALFSFVAMLCMIEAFKRGEAALVAPMQYSQLIWGTLFGIVFFSEYPKGQTLLGAALIIGSGLYIVFREAGAKPGAAITPPIAARRP